MVIWHLHDNSTTDSLSLSIILTLWFAQLGLQDDTTSRKGQGTVSSAKLNNNFVAVKYQCRHQVLSLVCVLKKYNILHNKIHASIRFFNLTFAFLRPPFSLRSSSAMGRGQDDVVFVQRSTDEGRSCWWQVTVGSTSPWLCPNTWGWSGGA